MTQGNILKILIRFAFPLFLGNLFQQMYNTVDSLVVGHFCGDNALAAVSSSGSLCFLIIGFFSQTSARLAPADVFYCSAPSSCELKNLAQAGAIANLDKIT